MKLTATQLRRIIKEEVSRVISETRSSVDPNGVMDVYDELYMATGAPTLEELESALGVDMGALTPDVLQAANLAVEDDVVVPSHLLEKQDLNKDGKNDFEDVMIARMKASGMGHEKAVKKAAKTKKNESLRGRLNRLSEGHARITQSEIEQWKKGNWGFISESDETETKTCNECGAEYVAEGDSTVCSECGL
jgi:hypothetical protein